MIDHLRRFEAQGELGVGAITTATAVGKLVAKNDELHDSHHELAHHQGSNLPSSNDENLIGCFAWVAREKANQRDMSIAMYDWAMCK